MPVRSEAGLLQQSAFSALPSINEGFVLAYLGGMAPAFPGVGVRTDRCGKRWCGRILVFRGAENAARLGDRHSPIERVAATLYGSGTLTAATFSLQLRSILRSRRGNVVSVSRCEEEKDHAGNQGPDSRQ